MAKAYAIGVRRECRRCLSPFRDMRDRPTPGLVEICSCCRPKLSVIDTARLINAAVNRLPKLIC